MNILEHGRNRRESMELWLDMFRGYTLPLAIAGYALTSVSPEVAVTLATAVIGLVVLVLNYLRERTPAGRVGDRLEALETRVTTVEGWVNREL